MVAIIISILSMLGTLVGVFYYRINNIYTAKSNTIIIINQIYDLLLRRYKITKENKAIDYSIISYIQLQIKSLLFELDQKAFRNLTQPQNRLIAECFEEFLYYKYAEKYWKQIFKTKFHNEYIESEYYRRYAQFLYKIGKEEQGKIEFARALELSNTDDGKRYINIQTYINWIQCEIEFIQKRRKMTTLKITEKSICVSLELINKLCEEIEKMTNLITDKNLNKNATNNMNQIKNEINKIQNTD